MASRLISLVEDASPRLREVMGLLAPLCGRAQVVGLDRLARVGKSTTTSALVAAYRHAASGSGCWRSTVLAVQRRGAAR